METIPLEILRAAFAQSAIATMATQVSSYLRLATHPDVLVADLVDALSRNAVIGDDAASRLYRRFGFDDPNVRPVARRDYWEHVLQAKGIDLNLPFYLPQANPAPATSAPGA